MRKWPLAFVLCWGAAIFASSCTVVTTDHLFAVVGTVVGPVALEQFEIFWGIVWFTVVKSWHVSEFAILTAGMIALLHTWCPAPRYQSILIAALIALLFAASDEFHQTYVPDRGGTIWDVLIDSMGILLVTLMALVRARRIEQAENPAFDLSPEAVPQVVVNGIE